MNRRKPMNARQLAREKLLFRYSSALERGDFETISAILREAETDPVLDQMLREMNDVYRAELAPPPALPSISLNHNHRNTREDVKSTMSVTFPTIRRVNVPSSQGRWTSTVTLAAAIIAIIVFAAILISRRPPNQEQQAHPGLGLNGETATPIPSATPLASLTWTPTPVAQQPNLTWTPTAVPPLSSGQQDTGIIIPTMPLDTLVMCQGIVYSTDAVDGINLFSDSSNNGVYMGRIPLGSAVNILGWRGTGTGDWFYVRSSNAEGWISAAYVGLTSTCVDSSGQVMTYLQPCGYNTFAMLTPTFVPGQIAIPTEEPVLLTATAYAATAFPATTVPPCTPVTQPPPYDFTPTPTAGFDLALRSGGYDLMTNEQVGDIPANALVRINTAQFDGTQWLYDVIAKDGQTRGLAYEYQLSYAPGVTPGAPTPTAMFGSSIGMGMYSALTKQPIGDIPAGALVRIGSAWYNGVEWIYQVQDENGRSADARESQLVIAPGYAPGMPTPTAPFFDRGNLVTLVQIGSIPAGTLVQTTSGYFNGSEWVYTIVTLDGLLADVARDSQLGYASGNPYGPGPTSTPFLTFTPTAVAT